MIRTARRVAGFGTTVFSEFSALAQQHGAINLGQGFPDFEGPEEIREAAVHALRNGVNQYAMGAGAPELRRAIAEHSRRFYGMDVDPDTMVTVTSGATEAIFDTIVGLIDPGDEVVLFEPFYDSYDASVTMAGGVPRHVPLRPPDAAHPSWWFDEAELRAAFTPRTRLLVLNTPHNPTGKVFTLEELTLIGELCERHEVNVLSDEVYEHIAFAPARHVRPATLPAFANRTVTVSSAGKSFSFTGWKIGWIVAPPELRRAVQSAHQFITFASAAPLQAAVAHALRMPDGYFARLQADYTRKRDRLVAALAESGLRPFVPDGTYFAMADLSPLGFDDDFAFCRFLTTEVGVAAIPPSAFYS
ncbi:MAG: aminotransferase class I/II-fold pyridoxal phosphate-dependent enzyme, partial [Myxococcales bacterium]